MTKMVSELVSSLDSESVRTRVTHIVVISSTASAQNVSMWRLS